MAWFRVLVLCISLLLIQGENVPVFDVEQLQPIMIAPDSHGHVNPVLVESVKENNLLGRPDGHDGASKPLIGQPDGHDGTSKPLLGRPDGHEDRNKPLIGQPDGHEDGNKPLIGQPDGHEVGKKPLLGQPDGHDDWREPLIDQSDGHDFREMLIGRPDGHDGSGTGSKNKDSGSESKEEHDEWWMHEEMYDNSYDDVYDYGDDERELIRCKRPLCRMFCSEGFQTDEMGCPVCACLEDPCEKMECSSGKTCLTRDCLSPKNCKKLTAECIDKFSQPCATPMCANYCEFGYRRNERGCDTCDCANSPEVPLDRKQVDCPAIDCVNSCLNGHSIDENGCTTCRCKGDPKTFPCAEPMCANACDYGYKKNERGCMTCDCVETSCPVCAHNEICQNRTEKSEIVSFCAPKPLCLLMKDGRDKMAVVNAHKCESDGRFSPLQCNDIQSQCWCVDDRGVVIDGTRTSVYIDEQKPHCERNITVSVTMRMRLSVISGNLPGYETPFTIPDLLKNSLPQAIGDCMLVDRQYISVIKTEEMLGRDETGDVKAASGMGEVVYAEAGVRHDGFVDLPSAINHMIHEIQSDSCLVAVESGAVLRPQLESLDFEYKFSQLPIRGPLVTNVNNGMYSTEGSWSECFAFNHGYLVLFAALLAGLVLISVILLAVLIARRRRRMRMLNFQHQRLESQISTSSEKNFLDGRDDNVLLISSGPIEEKATHA